MEMKVFGCCSLFKSLLHRQINQPTDLLPFLNWFPTKLKRPTDTCMNNKMSKRRPWPITIIFRLNGNDIQYLELNHLTFVPRAQDQTVDDSTYGYSKRCSPDGYSVRRTRNGDEAKNERDDEKNCSEYPVPNGNG